MSKSVPNNGLHYGALQAIVNNQATSFGSNAGTVIGYSGVSGGGGSPNHPPKYKIGDHGKIKRSGVMGVIGDVTTDSYGDWVYFFWHNDGYMGGSDGKYPTSGQSYSRAFMEPAIDYEIDFMGALATPPKPLKFDLTALDALIMDKLAKEEIVAVLEQHKNGKKIFEEWGLGETIEYGKGMTFLFYGPPGTGKTWGAHCIAKVVGQEMISIGGAEIHSSEPGAANRNIKEAFATAKTEGKILFIDECDSLITNRGDVGMIIGGEINTLLTEIEKAEGIVILATNQVERLDEALERRIGLIIEFPEPNHAQRVAIFDKLIPKKMPLEKEVTPLSLADHKLTGGQIKNVILQAARLAISGKADKVGLKHFVSAITRVQASKSLLGSASRYRQNVIKEDFDVTKG